MTTPRRVAVTVLIPLVLAGCVPGRPAAGPSAPAPAAVTASVACHQMLPHLRAAADLILYLTAHPDADGFDLAGLGAAIRELRHVRDTAPPDMSAALATQIDTLTRVSQAVIGQESLTLDLRAYRDSGMRLVDLCEGYG